MPSLLGCLFVGLAVGLLCRAARLCSRDEGLFFTCAVAACGAVLGGLAAAPLLGFVSKDAAHFTLAEALGSITGSCAVIALARIHRRTGHDALANADSGRNVVPRTDAP